MMIARVVWVGSELVDRDEDYVRAQAASLGSGALGGWSQANLGGFFEERTARDKEIRDEVRALADGARRPPRIAGADKP